MICQPVVRVWGYSYERQRRQLDNSHHQNSIYVYCYIYNDFKEACFVWWQGWWESKIISSPSEGNSCCGAWGCSCILPPAFTYPKLVIQNPEIPWFTNPLSWALHFLNFQRQNNTRLSDIWLLAVIGDELISENRGIAFRHGRAFHIEKVHEEIWELEHFGRFCRVFTARDSTDVCLQA